VKISVFLSYPKPFMKSQQKFINDISDYLHSRNIAPRTLGVTDYDMNEPLTAIRRLMLESNGLLTIAFRRAFVEKGTNKPESDLDETSAPISNQWMTSPYCQIEPAMAFQIGLPILILREQGVMAEGILEKGVAGTYLPEFNLSVPTSKYLESGEWQQIIGQWEGYVRSVIDKKGYPPRLY